MTTPPETIIEAFRDSHEMLECNLDFDCATPIDRALMESTLDILSMLAELGTVTDVYRRKSSGGDGYHVIFFIPLKRPSLTYLKEDKNAMFGLRLVLGDDPARVASDVVRLKATDGQSSVMVLFDHKQIGDDELKHCGEWERIA